MMTPIRAALLTRTLVAPALVTLAAPALVMLATPALAGDPASPAAEAPLAPPPPPLAFVAAPDWAGGYAGVQIGYADVAAQGGPLDGNGELYGLHGGYRWDLGTAIVGAEVDWDKANVDLGAVGTLDSVARVKLIGGADLGPAFVYATTGAAWADATVSGSALSDRGWFLGAGMDYAITETMTVGGEVLGHRFDNFDNSGVDLDATTVRARVSFQF